MIKVTTIGEDWLKGFEAMEENLAMGHFGPFCLNRVNGKSNCRGG